jgi:hypothetical protein
MSVTINAKGTSVPTFAIGKNGTTIDGPNAVITPPSASDLTISVDEDNYLVVDAGLSGPALITASSLQDLHINPAIGGGQYLVLNANRWPTADGTSGQLLATNGAGVLGFVDGPELTNPTIVAALGYTPVDIAGDTMTGTLVLASDPVSNLDAATKQYVDNASMPTGGGNDKIFYENGQLVTTDYTVTGATNAMSAGPVTVDDGVTVTVESGGRWVII